MSRPNIKQPGNIKIKTKNISAELKFNTNFRGKWQQKYDDAQKFTDSEVLRLSEPYIPKRTGMLIDSGILGTDIGSGEVKWTVPYARRQYFSPRKPGSQTGPLRGPHWFERMWKVKRAEVIEGIKERIKRK